MIALRSALHRPMPTRSLALQDTSLPTGGLNVDAPAAPAASLIPALSVYALGTMIFISYAALATMLRIERYKAGGGRSFYEAGYREGSSAGWVTPRRRDRGARRKS
jgi:hypothetical protein